MAKNSGEGALWFCAGAALGATIALLYAPHSGEHTRRKIKKVARTSADKMAESGRQISELGKELYEKGLQMADEANSMFERGRKLINDPELAAELGDEG
jgi:gas vesicle protein